MRLRRERFRERPLQYLADLWAHLRKFLCECVDKSREARALQTADIVEHALTVGGKTCDDLRKYIFAISDA